MKNGMVEMKYRYFIYELDLINLMSLNQCTGENQAF